MHLTSDALLHLEWVVEERFLARKDGVYIVATPSISEHHQIEMFIALCILLLEVVHRILDIALELGVEQHIGVDVVGILALLEQLGIGDLNHEIALDSCAIATLDRKVDLHPLARSKLLGTWGNGGRGDCTTHKEEALCNHRTSELIDKRNLCDTATQLLEWNAERTRKILDDIVDYTSRLHHRNKLIAREVSRGKYIEHHRLCAILNEFQHTSRRLCCRECERAQNTLLGGECCDVGLASNSIEHKLTHTIVRRVDCADLGTRLGLHHSRDIDMATIYTYCAECYHLVDSRDEVTTLRQELSREVILEGWELHLAVEFTTIGVNVHTDEVALVRCWAEREAKYTILVGLGDVASGAAIEAQRVLHRIAWHWRELAIRHLNRGYNLARAIELVGDLGMDCIVDVVTNLYYARVEERSVEVGLPLGVGTQGVAASGDSCGQLEGVVEASAIAYHSQSLHHDTRCIDQLDIDKLGLGGAIEVDGVHQEGTEVDGIASTIERFVGHHIELLLNTTRSVVVDEAIGDIVGKTYRRCIRLRQLLCRERHRRDKGCKA